MKKWSSKLAVFYLIVFAIFSSCSESKIKTTDNYEVVEFPDGSVAFLNHNSSIIFDKEFDQRNVTLKGEAFFDIQEADEPFIVKTEVAEITVLGTEFNVKSNSDDIEVEVEEGTVELSTKGSKKKINRGKKANFNKKKGEIKIGNATFNFRSWVKDLRIEWNKVERDVKKDSKKLKKEFKKIGKDIKKETKKLK